MQKKKTKLRPFQMYLRPDLYDNVKQLADKKGLSFSSYVRQAVERGLQREKMRNKKAGKIINFKL